MGHTLFLPSLPGQDTQGCQDTQGSQDGQSMLAVLLLSQFWPLHPCAAAPCSVSQQ